MQPNENVFHLLSELDMIDLVNTVDFLESWQRS